MLLGHLLVGVGIGFGAMTNAALLGGLFMNANVLLAGSPNPSAFYLVLQIVLLLAHAGAVVDFDARLAATIRSPLQVARPVGDRARGDGRGAMAAVAVLALAVAAYALRHVTDWTPAGSVEDPAMMLAILAGLSASWATIAALRADPVGSAVGGAGTTWERGRG